MDLFSFLATIILITSVVTLVVAIAAYVAYKIRDVRKPSRKRRDARSVLDRPIFLRPVSSASVKDLKHSLAKERMAHLQSQNKSADLMNSKNMHAHSSVKRDRAL
jgi:hypothetical protein